MDFIETFIMALAIFIVVYLFLLQPHHVQGYSMFPTFDDNDYILTDKVTYRFKKPLRGDIVVFKAPQNPKNEYIKRIIALPGEKIKISNGRYYIFNSSHIKGEILEEPYINPTVSTTPGVFAKEGEIVSVPDNQYFVSGDNRSHSSDSREWGTVPMENITGKAFLRYWPIKQLQLIPGVDYKL